MNIKTLELQNTKAPYLFSILGLLLIITACRTPIEVIVPTPTPMTLLSGAVSENTFQLIRKTTTAFAEQINYTTIEIEAFNTNYALQQLIDGESDFAVTTRYKPDLLGFEQIPIARDGVAIIVHPDNPVDNVTMLDLADLFSGKVFNWRDVPGSTGANMEVQVVTRALDSGTGFLFQEQVLTDRRMTPNARLFPTGQSIADYVADTPHAIGYISTIYISEKVKVISVEEVRPTQETLTNAAYPLTYLLYLVKTLEANQKLQDLAEFASGEAGQVVIAEAGYGRVN